MTLPKILIVDDDTAVHRALQKALKNEGYKLLSACNGQEGLNIVKKDSPILILLDLLMPTMDGFKFLQNINIKADDPYMVVVITGHGNDQEVQRCYDLGVDYFLRKPLSMVEICCLAKRCITFKQLEKERLQLIAELQKAEKTINSLKRLMPICASCKKVRDDNGYWQGVEIYFRKNADIDFTHSLCPSCVKKIYPEIPNK